MWSARWRRATSSCSSRRGREANPEQLQQYKSGLYHLAARVPDVPIVPVFLHGLGKALPRGEALLVPFFCDVFVGEPIGFEGDRQRFMGRFAERMEGLAAEMERPAWD